MSWDISFQKLPDVASVADIPDDCQLAVVGPRAEVVDRIVEAAPSADFSDPSWGLIDGSGWSIEVNMGQEDACTGFMLHVRGGGEEVIDVISAIAERTGLRGIDCSTGEFFTREAARDSFAEWQDFRDQVVQEPEPKRGFFAKLFGK